MLHNIALFPQSVIYFFPNGSYNISENVFVTSFHLLKDEFRCGSGKVRRGFF